MKKLALILILIFLASLGAAKVNYRIDAGKDKVRINSSIKMECSECPVSRWKLTWKLPENAEVIWANGSEGRAKEVNVEGDSVVVRTETPPQDSEIIRIGMEIEEDATEITEGLHKRKLSLPGFNSERTAVSISNENLISGWVSFGFQSSFKDNEMRAVGEGPVNLRIKFGEGRETEYYEFFGYEPNGSEDETYRIAVGTVGVVQQFKRFPVAVMSDRRYNISVNRWSAGEYVSGSIQMRNSLGEDFLPILAHEAVHGLNDRFLRWDDTDSSYFNEGTAKYTEYLMRKKLYRSGEIDVGPAEIFGEPRKYETVEDQREFVYTVRPRGNRERLWEYYQENKSFMKRWSPFKDSTTREFGYAYSELIIRNHVMRNGSVRELYRKMDFDSKVESFDEKWRFYSRHLDMTPCKYDSRERFNQCLEKINEYDYPVFISSPNINSQEIVIKEHELPERTERKGSLEKGFQNLTKDSSSLSGLKATVGDLIARLQSFLSGLT